MKKFTVVLLVTLVLCLALAVSAYAQNKTIVLQIGSPNMTVDGVNQEIDPGRGTQPVIISGTTLVPIRTIIENMGGTIAWDGPNRQITVLANNKAIRMTLDYINAEIKPQVGGDWAARKLLVAPKSINGRTMVPLRFVTEELGAKVDWNGATKTITITLAAAVFDPLNWTASWTTTEGIISLKQSGNTVVSAIDTAYWGKINGTASGKTFTGKWYKGVDSQGDVVMTLSDDGKSFTGKWNYNYPGVPFVPNPDDPDDGWVKFVGER